MRYSPDHSRKTRARVLEAAGRAFRVHGFNGIGVDGLGRAARVTSGAIYGHFQSKAGAFRAAAEAGLDHLCGGVLHYREAFGDAWLARFVDYYLSEGQREDVAGGCSLPCLSTDISRADDETRKAYEASLLKVADAMAGGMPEGEDRTAAWPLLAQLVGAVVLARGVHDPAVAEEIAETVRLAALAALPRIPLPS